MTDELKPVNCGCGGEAKVIMLIPEVYAVECSKCYIRTGSYAPTEAEAIKIWNRAMGADQFRDVTKKVTVGQRSGKTLESAIDYLLSVGWLQEHDKELTAERTAKATRKPEAFFYRCECGYGLCCEKNDMNYCPYCGGRLEWK